jgi:hypothetical protein
MREERYKLKSTVARRRPIDVEIMMEKQRLKCVENIFILYLLAVDETTDEGDERRLRWTRRLMRGTNGGGGVILTCGGKRDGWRKG